MENENLKYLRHGVFDTNDRQDERLKFFKVTRALHVRDY